MNTRSQNEQLRKEQSSSMFEDSAQREVSPQTVENAPCITYGQFRQVAKQRDWSIDRLVDQVKGKIDAPTDTLRRIMHGAQVDGKHQLLADVPLPYTCLIELYQRATQPKPAPDGGRLVVVGVGVLSGASNNMLVPFVGRGHRGHEGGR
jgi:hypothetical protein